MADLLIASEADIKVGAKVIIVQKGGPNLSLTIESDIDLETIPYQRVDVGAEYVNEHGIDVRVPTKIIKKFRLKFKEIEKDQEAEVIPPPNEFYKATIRVKIYDPITLTTKTGVIYIQRPLVGPRGGRRRNTRQYKRQRGRRSNRTRRGRN